MMNINLKLSGLKHLKDELYCIKVLSKELELRVSQIEILCDSMNIEIAEDEKSAITPVEESLKKLDEEIPERNYLAGTKIK